MRLRWAGLAGSAGGTIRVRASGAGRVAVRLLLLAGSDAERFLDGNGVGLPCVLHAAQVHVRRVGVDPCAARDRFSSQFPLIMICRMPDSFEIAQRRIRRQLCTEYDEIVIITEPSLNVLEHTDVSSDAWVRPFDEP